MRSTAPTVKLLTGGIKTGSLSAGYVAQAGSEALVVVLGTACPVKAKVGLPCFKFATTPSQYLDSAKRFTKLWSVAQSYEVSHYHSTTYQGVASCVRSGGRWYISVPTFAHKPKA